MMHFTKPLMIVQGVLMLALLSCRSTTHPAGSPIDNSDRSPVSAQDPNELVANAREASRIASSLGKQVEIANNALELGEQQLAQVRQLYDAGRRNIDDVRTAEEELLEFRLRLSRHERDLADADQDGAADEMQLQSHGAR